MKRKDDQPGDASELRHRAEAIARGKAALPPENLEARSPENMRVTLHELQVHQIELEMQNDELRRTQSELEAARARYFDLYDLAPVGYCTVSEPGLILEANLTASTLLGLAQGVLVMEPITRFILPEDQDIYYLHRKILLETGASQACELRMLRAHVAPFWAHLEAAAAQDADGTPVCRLVISDITERKFREDARELSERLIVLVESPGNLHTCMSELTASLQGWSGCEAVGIRLRDGEDYPYYETRGFPPAFVQEENHLCDYRPDGTILRNGGGNPVLECMCGNILCGRFDPAKPFFTAHGSFWSNSTTALLASTTEADRQGRTRNRCNGAGYESVALIPLRSGLQVFGLLQFNDRHPDRFTRNLIAYFEEVADSLANALSRRQAEEALRESEERFSSAFQFASIGMGLVSPEGKWIKVNRATCDLLGYSEDELLARTFQEITHPDDLAADLAYVRRVLAGEIYTYQMEKRYFHKTGHVVWVLLSVFLIRDEQGNALHFISQMVDITERKRNDEKLYYQANLLENVSDAIIATDLQYNIEFWNAAAEKQYGWTATEVIGHPFEKFIINDYLGDSLDVILQTISRDGYWKGEVMQNRRDGVRFPAISTLSMVKNIAIQPSGFIAVNRDISDRKRAEETLRESEERFRLSEQRLQSLFETMEEGVIFIAPDGQIAYANSAAGRIMGISRSEITSRNFIAPQWEMLRPDGTVMPPEEMAGPRAMKEKLPVKDVVMGVKRPNDSN